MLVDIIKSAIYLFQSKKSYKQKVFVDVFDGYFGEKIEFQAGNKSGCQSLLCPAVSEHKHLTDPPRLPLWCAVWSEMMFTLPTSLVCKCMFAHYRMSSGEVNILARLPAPQ